MQGIAPEQDITFLEHVFTDVDRFAPPNWSLAEPLASQPESSEQVDLSGEILGGANAEALPKRCGGKFTPTDKSCL